MSETLQESVPVEQPGEVVDLGGATPAIPPAESDINWGDPEPQPVPAAAEPAVEPIAEPEVKTTATKTDGYEYATLQNGQRELTLETGQKYRGKDDDEIIAELSKAQINASRMIDDFKAKASTPAPPKPAQQEESVIDPSSQALLDLLAPSLGLKSGKDVAEAFQRLTQRSEETLPVVEELRLQKTAVDFVRSTPEFAQVNTPVNAGKIDSWLNERRLPFTVQNAQDAYFSLKGRGELEAIPASGNSVNRTATGQFAKSNVMPMPPAASAPVANSEPDPFSLSDKDFAKAFSGLRRTS